MRHLIVFSLALSLFVGNFSLVQAQSTIPAQSCECWCGLEGRGAESKGTAFEDESACKAKCDAVKEKFLSCSSDGDGTSPHTNLRCWSAEQCEAINTTTGEVTGSISDVQAAECMPGFTHCNSPERPIDLGVAIGPFSQVLDIGGYIAAVYQWLLGAGAVFAVIMIMVGGVQYMTSGGSSTGVTNAKKRIFGALIGVAILIASYAILATVNPQTLSLQLPTLPKVRPILIAGGGQACESFMDRGYVVENAGGRAYTDKNQPCGKKGIIKEGPDGETLSGDDECRFQGCAQGICRTNLETDESACHSCDEIYFVTAAAGSSAITGFSPGPSQATCAAAGVSPGSVGECLLQPQYFKALVRIPSQCEEYRISCASETAPCESYNTTQIFSGGEDDGADLLHVVQERVEWHGQEANFRRVCERNVCNYNAAGGGCKLENTSGRTWTCTAK